MIVDNVNNKSVPEASATFDLSAQLIHDRRLLGTCKGTYHGLIGYMANSGPINQETSGGGTPGRDGSLVVGRFTFTIH